MCGIAGVLVAGGSPADALRATATRMAGTLVHRGPDDAETWVDGAAGIGLGFRRLAILDLSPQGRQPMISADGRFVVVYNGEIYNWQDLREELTARGHRFRGGSDTEVALAAFTEWGVRDAVPRFNGMFAFAVWDRAERVLHLGRDRIGKKPLYYARLGPTVVFGSELKALRAHPAFAAPIDRESLSLYLRFGYVPSPATIYAGVLKLAPGSLVTIADPAAPLPAPVTYWAVRDAARAAARAPHAGSEPETLAAFDALLRDAVRRRMIADVPLGAFLSGGVDSSTVVALMQAQSTRPVKTFTIGFDDAEYDEASHARAVAKHLGTDHTELSLTSAETLAVIPKLPALYDEPFADSSQIPTYLVSALARRDVTVALSGDGGDELFGGYGRYMVARRVWRRLAPIPSGWRRAAARPLQTVAALPRPSPRAAAEAGRRSAWPDKLERLAGMMAADDAHGLYLDVMSHWRDPVPVVGASGGVSVRPDEARPEQFADFVQHMMCWDAATYLPDDVLTKVDRASMGVSLETRAPLLDHRVIAFAWGVPFSMKVRDGQGKWLLRRLLARYLPEPLVERPKMGFDVPIASWLRGPLRDWAETLLEERRLREDGLLDPAPIRRAWAEHLGGTRNRQHRLWTVLMFQLWREAQARAPLAAGRG